MLFAPSNASVIEFEHTPHVDRVFASIAMGLGLDYWLVPQLSATLRGNYTMDGSKAAAVVRLVQHLVETKDMLRHEGLRDEL